MERSQPKVKFIHILLPVLFLAFLIVYGMMIRPLFLDQPAFPLEVVFLLAAVFSIAELLFIGFQWEEIQNAFVQKFIKGLTPLLILFAIGVIIGTWIVSGTIPMLIFYGIKMINPTYIYFLAFFIPIIFSTLTGTSWGSVGTIGMVLIGIAAAIEADLGITAGAIIGGAYFGDKLSPLSDTTNMASMAVEVDLYEHIHSMLYTTLPSALIAGSLFLILGFVYPPLSLEIESASVTSTLNSISSIFGFSVFLLIPPIIVLYGSIRRKATLPTLLTSSIVACLLALIFQRFTMGDVMVSLHTGFNVSMASWVPVIPENISQLFNRGGLFELNEVIFFTIIVFIFVGSIDLIEAMPKIVDKVFSFAKSRPLVIISSLFATAFTNAITSNQNATSFIIGDAFRKRYEQFKIPRKVLSRSIEDYGTMVESIIPWSATTLFMVGTLGVPFSQYWHWQLLSLINLVVAVILAVTGKGCFYNKNKN